MNIGSSSRKPPSRQNKKQLMAWLDPVLVKAAHDYCQREGMTQQEILGMAINIAVATYGRTPFLKIRRDRLVNRKKSLAKKQVDAIGVRAGTVRIGGFFEIEDINAVKAFTKEVGIRIEGLVQKGLRTLLNLPLPVKSDNDTWDFSKIETANLKIDRSKPASVRSKEAA